MEIADSSVQPGAKVVTQKSKNTSNQKFKTEQVEDGMMKFYFLMTNSTIKYFSST